MNGARRSLAAALVLVGVVLLAAEAGHAQQVKITLWHAMGGARYDAIPQEIAAGFNMAQYIKHPSSPWYVVVLQRSPRQYLAPVNRFTLQMAKNVEVEQAHREFATNGKEIGITELGRLERTDGATSFIFSDLDRNWWELTSAG